MSYLLDTNVISELRKGQRCHARVRRWFEKLPEGSIYLSVVTLAEIRRGIERIRRRDADGAAHLEKWHTDLLVRFSDRILPIDQRVAEEWGRLNVPDPISVLDGFIAATARVYALTLATRNVSDFARPGLLLKNPWD